MPHSALINENYEGVIMKSYDQFFFFLLFFPLSSVLILKMLVW